MPLTFNRVTPTLVLDTTSLQNTVPVAGTKWKRSAEGKFSATTNNEGICATLVAAWLSHRANGVMVTGLDQFPGRFQLSIAQSAYEHGGTSVDDSGLRDLFGVKTLAGNIKKRKWYMWKSTRIKEVADAMTGWPGYYKIGIHGNGGHAIAAVTTGQVQFFDPNEGILDFNSAEDLRKWLPAYITSDYPDLLKKINLYAVGV